MLSSRCNIGLFLVLCLGGNTQPDSQTLDLMDLIILGWVQIYISKTMGITFFKN